VSYYSLINHCSCPLLSDDLQVRGHVVPSEPIVACPLLTRPSGTELDVYTDKHTYIHIAMLSEAGSLFLMSVCLPDCIKTEKQLNKN